MNDSTAHIAGPITAMRFVRGRRSALLISCVTLFFFFFSSRRRHTRFKCDWSSDVCSSDLTTFAVCALISHACYVLLISLIKGHLVAHAKLFNRIVGGTFIALGVGLLRTDRKSVV